ncbi:MAG: sigma 54-interacting transcriptional regulator [Blastocatellia bacterium]
MILRQSTNRVPGELPRRGASTEITRRLAQAATALREWRNEDAIGICEELLKRNHLRFADEVGARCMLAEALENLSRCAEAREKLAPLEESWESYDLALQIQICLRAGSTRFGTTPEEGLMWAKRAQKLANEHPHTGANGHILLLLGRLYRRLGEISFAETHYQEAVQFYQATDDKAALARGYLGLGIVRLVKGDIETANAAYLSADQLIREVPANEQGQTDGLIKLNRAVVSAIYGRLAESADLFERAAGRFREINPRFFTMSLSNLGWVLLLAGKIAQAEQVIQEAHQAALRIDDQPIAAMALGNLGEVCLLRGLHHEADNLLSQSACSLGQLKEHEIEAQMRLKIGRSMLMRRLFGPQTQTVISTALELAEKYGSWRWALEARLMLAEHHVVQSEYALARRIMGDVKTELRQNRGLTNLSLVGRLLEVESLHAMRQGDAGNAIRFLEQAVSVYEITGLRWELGNAHSHLAYAYTLAGNAPRAARNQAMAQEIMDSLGTNTLKIPLPEPDEMSLAAAHAGADPRMSVATTSLRLLETPGSEELLFHELTRILHQDMGAPEVILFETAPGAEPQARYRQGCDAETASEHGRNLAAMREQTPRPVIVREIPCTGARALTLYICPRDGGDRASQIVDETAIELLMQQAEQALARIEAPAPATSNLLTQLLARPVQTIPPPDEPGRINLIYQSTAMRKIVAQVRQIHSSRTPVLISGECGTGKELIARLIHERSARSQQPFIAVNCGAIPRDMVEAQLFGYRKGAFTGADKQHEGFIRAANGGTLFLDEIGELPCDMQASLLRFLQNDEIQPLGESRPVSVDTRVLSASNRDLEKMITTGQFREDLWHRLNVLELHLPPLRERREDIPLLVNFFLEQQCAREQKNWIAPTQEVLDILLRYDWPGNIRELENQIQRIVSFSISGVEAGPELLAPRIVEAVANTSGKTPGSLNEALSAFKRRLVLETLARHDGNRSAAARELQIPRNSLSNILRDAERKR